MSVHADAIPPRRTTKRITPTDGSLQGRVIAPTVLVNEVAITTADVGHAIVGAAVVKKRLMGAGVNTGVFDGVNVGADVGKELIVGVNVGCPVGGTDGEPDGYDDGVLVVGDKLGV
eukprot:CAMPEP_0202444238 /NCGR_PEP_ID=MMETSP1360-20130828/3381_1 /ASSEMBLY_ACC=CAM_ASM_000848 /TAXON_ID=515479 /ORGANISM="Licmophora paradoxa, Strain CCMP2313" /LENGTH=115 /DNA_ID=CAMNT_0049060185 /DNA_START=67 /DNA_END=415 /DNA_ORIENTATION=+